MHDIRYLQSILSSLQLEKRLSDVLFIDKVIVTLHIDEVYLLLVKSMVSVLCVF